MTLERPPESVGALILNKIICLRGSNRVSRDGGIHPDNGGASYSSGVLLFSISASSA
jgi:hypothetical protein